VTSNTEQREGAKRWFEVNGLSVTDWAVAHGFKREQVYAVLNGRTAGRRGTAHRIAVALGLKADLGSSEASPDSKPDWVKRDEGKRS
jgi:gp16 family phage-associated protein